jgi:anti-sigma regulatory factor (Ser/Thr protein kinase)
MARAEPSSDDDTPPDHVSGNDRFVLGRITRGVAALRAENRQLRLELERLRSGTPDRSIETSARAGDGADLAGDQTQIVLPADRTAPFAARTLLGLCAGPLLDARVLSDAQLLVSELVTNSLLHSGMGDHESIVVRIRLDSTALRLEVRNPGVTGTIASNGGDPEQGRGFGLDLVSLLSTSWGVRRDRDTAVWADVSRAAG